MLHSVFGYLTDYFSETMKKFLFFAVALALGCLCCHGQAYMDEVKIKERNLLSVYQNGNDKIMANGRPIDLSDLKMEVKRFMTPDPTSWNLPEVEIKRLALLGDVYVSKGMVCFTSESRSIGAYNEVMNEIAKAFMELRDELAWKKFHIRIQQLNAEQKAAILMAVPSRVVETAYSKFGIQVVEDSVIEDELEINNNNIERSIELLASRKDVAHSNVNQGATDRIDDEIFTVAETMPEYPGGMGKLTEYLESNLRYPREARENGIEGRVFVRFVVEKDGSITNASVARSIGWGCDEEALRLVRTMSKWIPGKQRGQAVRVSYVLPVRFKL